MEESIHKILFNPTVGKVAFLAITVVFSDKPGGLAVAFCVAGAGIAFALQEWKGVEK